MVVVVLSGAVVVVVVEEEEEEEEEAISLSSHGTSRTKRSFIRPASGEEPPK